jgi:hypothetical protein
VKEVFLNTERIEYWLSVGAQPSDRQVPEPLHLQIGLALTTTCHHDGCLQGVVAPEQAPAAAAQAAARVDGPACAEEGTQGYGRGRRQEVLDKGLHRVSGGCRGRPLQWRPGTAAGEARVGPGGSGAAPIEQG